MNPPETLDENRLSAFAAELREGEAVRVPRERLWMALARAFPHRGPGSEERQLLMDALQALADRGVVRLPSGRGRRWDRSMRPAVPTSVDLVREDNVAPSVGWRRFPWHPRLAWVAGLQRLSPPHVELLHRVHQGLVEDQFREPAPIQYRSLQLTGDEKGISALLKTTLFAPGRLSLDLIGCAHAALPLAWEAVNDGDRMLILENAGPFAVARRVLESLVPSPYDLVAYGGGRGLLAALAHIPTMERKVSSLSYVGDLDVPGLEIARAAAARCVELGLPSLRPASELHAAMLASAATFGSPDGWPGSRPGDRVNLTALTAGLGGDVMAPVQAMLAKGRRIPEEVLGPEELRRAWRGLP
jgi:hypothetical protein